MRRMQGKNHIKPTITIRTTQKQTGLLTGETKTKKVKKTNKQTTGRGQPKCSEVNKVTMERNRIRNSALVGEREDCGCSMPHREAKG